MEARWQPAIWLGRSSLTTEHMVGTPHGVSTTRSISSESCRCGSESAGRSTYSASIKRGGRSARIGDAIQRSGSAAGGEGWEEGERVADSSSSSSSTAQEPENESRRRKSTQVTEESSPKRATRAVMFEDTEPFRSPKHGREEGEGYHDERAAVYRCIQAMDGETLTSWGKHYELHGIPPEGHLE